MDVAALVVEERPLARRVLDVARRRPAPGAAVCAGELEDPERAPRVAAGPRGDQLLDLGVELDAELAGAAPDDLAQLARAVSGSSS